MAETPPLPAQSIRAESGGGYPEPFQSRMGQSEWRRLGDAFGLTQFGVNLETLQPGAQSALRHWHTLCDEFLYLLEGKLVLRMDAGETTMTPGMCVGFKAGTRDAHHFVNRSDQPARYLILGSRIPGDIGYYPDDDLMWIAREDGTHPAHKDGTPYWRPGKKTDPD
jgi:uncharacterized cupin superfamily protein